MLAEDRFALILTLLAEKRTATVQELCEALNVSEPTIRRDLLELECHLLKRPQPPHHSEEHDRCDGKQKQNAGDHIRRGDLI